MTSPPDIPPTDAEQRYLVSGPPKVFTPGYKHSASCLGALVLLAAVCVCVPAVLALLVMGESDPRWGLVALALIVLLWLVARVYWHPARQRFRASQSWRDEMLEKNEDTINPHYFVAVELDRRETRRLGRKKPPEDFGLLFFEPDALRFEGDAVQFRLPFSYLLYAANRHDSWMHRFLATYSFYLMLFKPMDGVHGIVFTLLDGNTLPQRRRIGKGLRERLQPLWTEAR